jgi:hypothetical protein
MYLESQTQRMSLFVVRADKARLGASLRGNVNGGDDNVAAEPHQHELVSDSFNTAVAFCVICHSSVSPQGWLRSARSSFMKSSNNATLRCVKCEISLHRSCAERLERPCGFQSHHEWRYSAFVLAEEPNVQCTVCRVRFSSSETTLWRCLHCFCKCHPHCRAYAEQCDASTSSTANSTAASTMMLSAVLPPLPLPPIAADTDRVAPSHFETIVPLPDLADNAMHSATFGVLVPDDELPRNARLVTESAREALFKGAQMPANLDHPDPGELISCILSIPCPFEIKQRDIKRKQERALVFHNLRLVTDTSIADFETQFVHCMGVVLASFYQLRMRDGIEWDQILHSVLVQRRATLRAAELVALDARLRFLRDVAYARRQPHEASLLVGCAADLMQNLEWLAVDPDSSVIGLRASAITALDALSHKILQSSVDVPPLLPSWLKEAAPSDAKAWNERILGAAAFAGSHEDLVERNAARLRCVQHLRSGDVALLRIAHRAPAAPHEPTHFDAPARAAPTMVYVRLLAWRHNGALVRARIGSRPLVVDPAALFGVPFDINDALRRVPSTIERHIDQAADAAFRAAHRAVIGVSRNLLQMRGVDVDALDALSGCKQLEVHPLLACFGVQPPPENPSAAYAAGGADAWPIVTPALARKLRAAVAPLRTLTQLASLPPAFAREAQEAAANAVERALNGAPGSGWDALSTTADVFIPSSASTARSSAAFAHESVARMHFSNQNLLIDRTLERLNVDIAAAFDNKMHNSINQWYLAAIETAVPAFLASRGFEVNAIPMNYLSQPPRSLFAVRMNFRIVQEVLNPRNDRHGFTLFLNELSSLIYMRLEEHATLLCCAIDRRVGAVPCTPDDTNAPANWFASDAEPLSSERVETMIRRSDTDSLGVTKLLKELKYIIEMRELEQCRAQERGELSQVVPVTGLIVSYLMRLDNEIRTVLTRWDTKFNQEALIDTVTKESVPEAAHLLVPDDVLLSDDDNNIATDDDISIPRELESNWSSASLPTEPYNMSTGPLIFRRPQQSPQSQSQSQQQPQQQQQQRMTIYQQLPTERRSYVVQSMSFEEVEDTTNKMAFWREKKQSSSSDVK